MSDGSEQVKLVVLRGEEDPPDAAVVIRGGANGIDPDRILRVAVKCFNDFGFYGVSVYVALDEVPIDQLCSRQEEIQRYGKVCLSSVARVHRAGFTLLATGKRPHFSLVLPDSSSETISRLVAAFDDPILNPGRN